MAGFMKLQTWHGTEEIDGEEPKTGYWACYSAPGFMDRTDLVGPCDSYTEAVMECLSMYGEEGEGSIASADELEAIEVLILCGVSEVEASRLVLRS